MSSDSILSEIFGNNDFYSGSLRAGIKNKEITRNKKEILELADMEDALSLKAMELMGQM